MVTERYALEAFWKAGWRTLELSTLAEQLKRPQYTQRRHPLQLAHPWHVRQRVRVVGGPTPTARPTSGVVSGPGWQLNTSVWVGQGAALVEGSWRSLGDRVAPEKMAEHLGALEKAWDLVQHDVPSYHPGRASRGREDDLPLWGLFVILVGVAIVAVVVVVALRFVSGELSLQQVGYQWRLKRRRKTFFGRLAERPGETPATAIEYGTLVTLEKRLRRVRCACGARCGGLEGAAREDTVFVGDRSITPLRWACARCGADRRTYVALLEVREAA